jgi:hypothetical protein
MAAKHVRDGVGDGAASKVGGMKNRLVFMRKRNI